MKDILTTLLEDSSQPYIVDEFMPDSLVIILAGQENMQLAGTLQTQTPLTVLHNHEAKMNITECCRKALH